MMSASLESIKLNARRSRKRRSERRGVALVMVLGAITILTVFLTELQEETSSELSAALAEKDAVRAEYYARSAINLSRLLIAMEPKIRTGIPLLQLVAPKLPQIPVWKFQDMVLGPFNGTEGTKSFNSMINADPSTSKNLGLSGGGHFELNIVDEDSKINLNVAATTLPDPKTKLGRQLIGLISSPEYNPLFEGRDLDNQFSDRQTVCASIIDWVDSENTGAEDLGTRFCDPTSQSTASGTEDNFYQMIGLSYRRKNAAFDSLDELRLVRGISDEFWSTFVDPDPSKPDKRILTVWGQGKINLATASAQTILAVICSDTTAQQVFCSDLTQVVPFLQMLSMAQSFASGIPIFGSAKEITSFLENGGQPAQDGKSAQSTSLSSMILSMLGTGLTLKPFKFRSKSSVEQQFGNMSKIFSIYADGIVPGFRKTTKVRIHAVVDFRLAQGIGEAFGVIPPVGGSATGGGTGQTGSQPNNALPGSMPPAAFDALVRSNPAGSVIYWRVE